MTDDTDTTDSTAQTDGTVSTETATETASPTETSSTTTDGGPQELDLREANVMNVTFERSGGGYRFSVTLLHDVHESKALVSQPERYAFW